METLLFAAPGTWGPTLAAGLFGLLIGSFLNVVIYRLPIMMQREWENNCADLHDHEPIHTDKFDLVSPRSKCPHCGHQIGALENIPVISYLVLRGKCKACKAPISARYPAIEITAGVMSAVLVWNFGSGYGGLASLVFGYLLLGMTFIDFDTMMLPDDMTLPLLWIGLLMNLKGTFAPLHDAVIGAAAGYMILWTINFLFKKVRGRDGMGQGDFKLLAALGAWMGWTMLPAIILMSSLVGAVVGGFMILFKNMGRENPIPFGPYLAAAGFICLLEGPAIISAITAGIGIAVN